MSQRYEEFSQKAVEDHGDEGAHQRIVELAEGHIARGDGREDNPALRLGGLLAAACAEAAGLGMDASTFAAMVREVWGVVGEEARASLREPSE